jgi:phosphoacetylglucosamine mutase
VKERQIFKTTDAERRLVKPVGLQDEIDKLVSSFSRARSFVRPSGTEDVVRVYAEAETQEMTYELAYQVACLVHEKAGGLEGQKPQRS